MNYPEEPLTRLMQGKPVSKAAVHELELDGYIAHNGESFQPAPAGTQLLNNNHQENPS